MKLSSTALVLLASLTLCCAAPRPPAPTAGSAPAGTSAKTDTEVHGIDPASMNASVSACQDFNQYGNGGWMKANPIPPDKSRWGSGSALNEKNHERLRRILEKTAADASAAPGSDERKIGDFWTTCMYEASFELRGFQSLSGEFARIDRLGTVADLQSDVAHLQTMGVDVLFQFGSEQDRKNSSEVIAAAFQGGLGLPDRDYYTKTDESSQKLREQYLAHVGKMFVLIGEDPAEAASHASDVMALETRLAQASMTKVEQRDPDKTYNRKSLDELSKLTPNFSWTAYLHDLNAPPVAAVNVGMPKFFEAVNQELHSTTLPQWKTYLRWHLVHAAAPYLSPKFVEEDFAFYGHTLQGTPQIEERWKRCVTSTDHELGFALGKAYVKEHFPPEAKARADAMVNNLIAALREDLRTLPWMGEETRRAALAKLEAFKPKIGYPDEWRDYSSLTIDRGPYIRNVWRAEQFEFARDLAKIGKPVDRNEWGMTPPTVNAYYNPQKNEIVFPAGILQPPFFDAQADDAVNYGALGAVIGHEMTHGFDDQGRKFDGEGNMRDWWTAEDTKNYEARAQCVEEQYDSYAFEGQHVTGKLVLGEAIADLGGLDIAHRAYRKSLEGRGEPAPIDGFSGDQRFFLGWARVWAANLRPEYAKLMLNTNPHALPEFRAIGPPSTLPDFAKAFGCKPGDPMVRKELCRIW